MNNEPAVMRIGAAVGAAFTAGDPPPLPATIALTITPQIGADGIVQHDVVAGVRRIEAARPRRRGSVIEADTRDARARRRHGGHRRADARMERCGAGRRRNARRRGTQIRMRRELVVLLTPTVVNAGVAPAAGAQ